MEHQKRKVGGNVKAFFRKPYRWAIIYTIILTAAVVFVLLDTFVIPRSLMKVEQAQMPPATENLPQDDSTEIALVDATQEKGAPETSEPITDEPVISANSYADDNISATIETTRIDDTTVYIADIQLSDPSYLKTALAQNTYGRNIEQTTSTMSAAHNAIFAVNGDYYGFRDVGFVLRNEVLYRNSGDGQALIIDTKGDLSVVNEEDTDLSSLAANGAAQALSFGPALVLDGEIVVTQDDEVGRAKASNPRTAIGQIGSLHYLFIVSDGRTNESEGLSLSALAKIFTDRGATIAYNLDGGGSSTMVFMGNVINNPTSGRRIKEREVSDIVYIGYE
jgi:exopolysaccharide biosynthesis protein